MRSRLGTFGKEAFGYNCIPGRKFSYLATPGLKPPMYYILGRLVHWSNHLSHDLIHDLIICQISLEHPNEAATIYTKVEAKGGT